VEEKRLDCFQKGNAIEQVYREKTRFNWQYKKLWLTVIKVTFREEENKSSIKYKV